MQPVGNPVDMDARAAASAFGLDSHLQSLCPYGPVYKAGALGAFWVLKRTGYPRSNASAIAGWLHELRDKDVDVVWPSQYFKPNPRQLREDERHYWVVYPFIKGRPYRGSMSDIVAAGKLLGLVHKYGATIGLRLLEPKRIEYPSRINVQRTLNKLAATQTYAASGMTPAFFTRLEECYDRANLIDLRAASPITSCSWDFKASNLIYSSDSRPVLVDPDHAGRLPRVYDLACALLLFHCDHPHGPRRLWQPNEWASFVEAYQTQVRLSGEESEAWSTALATAWLAEALWLLANFPEGWADENEANYLFNLLSFDPNTYPLPRS